MDEQLPPLDHCRCCVKHSHLYRFGVRSTISGDALRSTQTGSCAETSRRYATNGPNIYGFSEGSMRPNQRPIYGAAVGCLRIDVTCADGGRYFDFGMHFGTKYKLRVRW